MDPFQFARNYLGRYVVRDDEIIPDFCPLCKGGDKRDKGTFALNARLQTWNCKRGSCGRQGHFSELCKEFGVDMTRDNTYELRTPKKRYVKPKTQIETAKERVEKYLLLRGISKEVWERRGVGENNGNIVFPYIENGEVVMNKFRKPEKHNGTGPKMWREDGGKPILWGMDLVDFSNPLVLVEGEMDCMILDECGIENAVSVPSGSSDLTWIDLCWDWLEKFKRIIIWGDNDEAGQEMVRKVIRRLGEWRCYVVDCEHKDANECLFKEGPIKTAGYVFGAKPVPIHGLLNLSDVAPIDMSSIERIKSGIKEIDISVGGFLLGELSVWTGKSGQGKSTFLGQALLEAVQCGYSVCAYSGELRADRFQYWVHLQAAGKRNIEERFDAARERFIYTVPRHISDSIKAWYNGKFWLYDNNLTGHNEETGIIKLFSFAARKYDCKMFLVDNLMTSRFDTGRSDSDYYRAQSKFVGELIFFAKQYNVHVHLVAHPRKTDGRLNKEAISGSGDITNRADNVFSIERADDPLKTEHDATLSVLKNRAEGVQGLDIGLYYDPVSRRMYQNKDGLEKKYGWET